MLKTRMMVDQSLDFNMTMWSMKSNSLVYDQQQRHFEQNKKKKQDAFKNILNIKK